MGNQLIKFSDEELISLHNQRFSDNKIKVIFKVTLSAIRRRRAKLGLEANYFNFRGEKSSKDELKEFRINENRKGHKPRIAKQLKKFRFWRN